MLIAIFLHFTQYQSSNTLLNITNVGKGVFNIQFTLLEIRKWLIYSI